eukprot:scaffold551_cov69-Phaeocystis_antarctica.AAC.2
MLPGRVAISCSCTASTRTAQPRQYRPVPLVICRTCSTSWPRAAAGRSRSMHVRPSISRQRRRRAPTRRACVQTQGALTGTPWSSDKGEAPAATVCARFFQGTMNSKVRATRTTPLM